MIYIIQQIIINKIFLNYKKDLIYLILYYIIIKRFGSIAQLGEHLPYKQRVIGSSPIVPTKKELSESLVLFLSIAKAMVYHQQWQFAIVVSHQSARTVYHHALACIKKAFTMMIYRNKFRMICKTAF